MRFFIVQYVICKKTDGNYYYLSVPAIFKEVPKNFNFEEIITKPENQDNIFSGWPGALEQTKTHQYHSFKEVNKTEMEEFFK